MVLIPFPQSENSARKHEVEPGALFVTLSGSKTDGHRYVAQALEKGAAAILCREPPRTGSWLSTPDPRAALARVSAAWFGYPGEEMTLIGVTGTNGKTTTTYLIKAMLEGALKTIPEGQNSEFRIADRDLFARQAAFKPHHIYPVAQ